MHNITDSNGLLLYRVGPVLVCSSTMPVEAVIIPPKITVPPGANVAEPGMFKSIHGMVRLVDLRVRFGVDESDYAKPGKIIIVEVEGGHAGFWVDEIEDVTGFPDTGWAQVPAYIPQNVFSRTWIKNQNIRLYADFEKLDKFKTSGYLRQHIEKLKSVEIDALDKNNKNDDNKKNSSRKNSISDSTTKFSTEDKKQLGVAHSKINIKEDKEDKEEAKYETLKSVANQNKFPRIINDIKARGIAQKDNSTKPDKKDKNKVYSSGDKIRSDPGFKKSIIENKKTSNNKVEHSSFNKNTPVNLSDHKNNFYAGHVSKKVSEGRVDINENESGSKWKFIIGGLLFLVVYAVYKYTGPDMVTGEEIYRDIYNTPTKDVDSIKYNEVLENKPIESTAESDKLAIDDLETEDVQVEALETKVDIEVEKMKSNVEITTLKDGILIVIDEYVENKKSATIVLGDENPDDTELDVFEMPRPKVQNDKHVSIVSDDEADDVADIVESKEVYDADKNTSNKTIEKSPVITSSGLKIDIKETPDLSEISLLSSLEKEPVEKNKVKSGMASVEKIKLAKPISLKYVHIVVKGDTLWHIAKRYVNNPWRYPELARLSRIKNPDLIYPGNKVTIIINYKK